MEVAAPSVFVVLVDEGATSLDSAGLELLVTDEGDKVSVGATYASTTRVAVSVTVTYLGCRW